MAVGQLRWPRLTVRTVRGVHHREPRRPGHQPPNGRSSRRSVEGSGRRQSARRWTVGSSPDASIIVRAQRMPSCGSWWAPSRGLADEQKSPNLLANTPSLVCSAVRHSYCSRADEQGSLLFGSSAHTYRCAERRADRRTPPALIGGCPGSAPHEGQVVIATRLADDTALNVLLHRHVFLGWLRVTGAASQRLDHGRTTRNVEEFPLNVRVFHRDHALARARLIVETVVAVRQIVQ